jgi:DNA polymerase, archaea type
MSELNGFDLTENIVGFAIESYKSMAIYRRVNSKIVKETRQLKLFAIDNESRSHSSAQLDGEGYYKHAHVFNNTYNHRQFTREFKETCYSPRNPVENYIIGNGLRMYRNLSIENLVIHSFDIETTGLDPYAPDAKIILITNTVQHTDGTLTRKTFSFDDYEHEGNMLVAWCQWVNEINPDIILGHNIYNFDLPYIETRAKQFGCQLFLGRENKKLEFDVIERKFRLDQGRNLQFKQPNAPGRILVDTLLLTYKWDIGKRLSSYALKKIIAQEKLEQENRVFYDASTIRKNYMIPKEMVKIKAYAEFDADDGLNLFKHIAGAFYASCSFIPMSFQEICVTASGKQIDNIFASTYLCQGHSLPKTSEKNKFQGAISFGIPGVYNNAKKIDLKSMYPSIILKYKVYDKRKDPRGYILQFTQELREMRLKYKKLYKETGEQKYSDLDGVAKSFLNSFYGFFGTSGLLFNSPDCAQFITGQGREILLASIYWATGLTPEQVGYAQN